MTRFLNDGDVAVGDVNGAKSAKDRRVDVHGLGSQKVRRLSSKRGRRLHFKLIHVDACAQINVE